MSGYIKRQTALACINDADYRIIQERIKGLPAEDVKENIEAKWIKCDVFGFKRCSNCKTLWDQIFVENKFVNHCPTCGAKIIKKNNKIVDEEELIICMETEE